MAHPPTLREFRSWLHALRDHLALDCLLCRTRAPGGLCRHCCHAVCASMASLVHRCGRCGLALRPERLHSTACPDCRLWSPALDQVVAAFDYAWPGDLLIQRLKLQGRYACAPLLASLLAQRCRAAGRPGPGTLVTAVPASRRSLALRGYNPAGETGRALARRLALEWRPGAVVRLREGSHQKGLGRRARHLGVEGLYRCPGGVAGRDILIVDDVMTTGSTLDAVAQALKAQGAVRVWGAVLARTPHRVANLRELSGTDPAAFQ